MADISKIKLPDNNTYNIKDTNALPKAGGTLTGRVTTTKALNDIITGSATAAQDKGSGVSPRYFPTKWTFNTSQTATNGDIIVIKTPNGGHDYGVFLSINNGTNYYPISINIGKSRLSTHYGSGTYMALIFNSNGATNSVYPLDGGDARVNVTGGAWYVMNYYDTGNTYDRNRYNQAIKAWGTKILNGNIIVADSNAVYHHLKQGTAFDIRHPILYLATDVNANATTTNTYDCIPFTITTTQSITLTAYKPVYIKGTLAGTTFTPVSTAPLTQTMTNNDGKYYMLLGVAYSTTGVYLIDDHRIFVYKGNVAYDVASVSTGVEANTESGSTTETAYGVAFVPNPNNSGEFNSIRKSNDAHFNIKAGTAGGEGKMELVLGNATAKSAAGNKTGILSLYSEGTAAHEIKGASTSSVVNHTLPAKSGTIYNSGNLGIYREDIDLSTLTFGGSGPYYSSTKDYSSKFSKIYAANLYNYAGIGNVAIDVCIGDPNSYDDIYDKIWFMVYSASSYTPTGHVNVQFFGELK